MSDKHLSPANAIVLLQRDDGRILAVRHNATSGTCPNQVTVIGGKLEDGEFLDEGAARELSEEVGITSAQTACGSASCSTSTRRTVSG
ncbi:8-oxo-dGTP pyrophosphatase MutT (NUDIX family) [Streptomyces umbrinus]|uniref:8-oxo-dGTP pyrophosphatase MutT (NUDIX family) n=1 Tax=Streptomyces umbrinus TaxID=67370 RepID=A0ABU0TC31_9ACTN|nr:NUDIX hydrolase [Streptomyces umbrinus]MDQ1033192.1 8-oxo-dGTP pyrophosphatase MutT (NUDIX family) [Streptomyces umbrinus]